MKSLPDAVVSEMIWNIELRQLGFGYGDGPPLFDALDWGDSLAPSEVLAVLGRSGTGKSTLLELIAGLKRPCRGSIILDGEDITTLKPASRRCAVVFQERSLFPGSVSFNLDFALRCRRVPAAERRTRIKSLLQLVALEHYERQSVDALSGGERQRVELARALASEPRLLLLDEPLGQLDGPLKKELVGQVRKWVKSQHVRAIYVTHDTSEAFTVADRLSVLGPGRLTPPRPPAEVYLDPVNLGEAQLTGTINLISTVVDRVVGGGVVIRPETGHWVEIHSRASLSPGQLVQLGFRPSRVLMDGQSLPNPPPPEGLRFSGVLSEMRLIDGLTVGDVEIDGAHRVSLQVTIPLGGDLKTGAATGFTVSYSDLLLFTGEGHRVPVESFHWLDACSAKPG